MGTADGASGLDAGEDLGEDGNGLLGRRFNDDVSRDAEAAIGMDRIFAIMRVGGGEGAAENHKRNAQQAEEEFPPRKCA